MPDSTLPLIPGLQPPASLAGLTAPVWGVDPSTLRMSFGALLPAYTNPVAAELAGDPPRVRWSTVSLPKNSGNPARWFGLAHERIAKHVLHLRGEWGVPDLVLVEEPFGGSGKPGKGARTVHPSSNRMLGVLLAALGQVLGIESDVQLIGPSSWKKTALGQGYGSAPPERYFRWARDVAGYTGELMDEAAAIGVATAAGVKLIERRGS